MQALSISPFCFSCHGTGGVTTTCQDRGSEDTRTSNHNRPNYYIMCFPVHSYMEVEVCSIRCITQSYPSELLVSSSLELETT